MLADWRLRPFRSEDGAAVLDVHVQAILQLDEAIYKRAELESWAHGLEAGRYAEMANEERFELAVDRKDRAIAFCSVKPTEIMGLYVHPDWAGKGIASRLLGWAEDFLRQNGETESRIRASLTVESFYHRRGYRTVGHHDWPSRGGLVMRACTVSKLLEPGAQR